MFIWIVENRNKYISGIFKSVKNLNKYMALTEKAGKNSNQSVYSSGIEKYPFFILEANVAGKKFHVFKNNQSLIKFVKESKLKEYIKYEITKDYQPSKPGIDEMGLIPHDHFE